MLHRDTTSIAICNWYYSPSAGLEDIETLQDELVDMQNKFDYVILAGDLNVHQVSWLRFSREDTARGGKLKHICDTHGLKQIVKQATRGPYLLDLVLLDNSAVKAKLGKMIADHSSLIIHVPDGFEERKFDDRHVWHYRDANWTAMEQAFANTD